MGCGTPFFDSTTTESHITDQETFIVNSAAFLKRETGEILTLHSYKVENSCKGAAGRSELTASTVLPGTVDLIRYYYLRSTPLLECFDNSVLCAVP